MLDNPYPTSFPKYIPKGKLANFLDTYTMNQDLFSSSIASTPVYDSSFRKMDCGSPARRQESIP
ncbi:hypothetical protein BDR04DRAFT_1099261 [Suillus decipiens]|nr:hypothetical protein BDR04DRAFT_1099261 [Suillus decipiens]